MQTLADLQKRKYFEEVIERDEKLVERATSMLNLAKNSFSSLKRSIEEFKGVNEESCAGDEANLVRHSMQDADQILRHTCKKLLFRRQQLQSHHATDVVNNVLDADVQKDVWRSIIKISSSDFSAIGLVLRRKGDQILLLTNLHIWIGTRFVTFFSKKFKKAIRNASRSFDMTSHGETEGTTHCQPMNKKQKFMDTKADNLELTAEQIRHNSLFTPLFQFEIRPNMCLDCSIVEDYVILQLRIPREKELPNYPFLYLRVTYPLIGMDVFLLKFPSTFDCKEPYSITPSRITGNDSQYIKLAVIPPMIAPNFALIISKDGEILGYLCGCNCKNAHEVNNVFGHALNDLPHSLTACVLKLYLWKPPFYVNRRHFRK